MSKPKIPLGTGLPNMPSKAPKPKGSVFFEVQSPPKPKKPSSTPDSSKSRTIK